MLRLVQAIAATLLIALTVTGSRAQEGWHGIQLQYSVVSQDGGQSLSDEEISAVVETIQERIQELGAEGATVLPVSGQNQIVVQLPLVSDSTPYRELIQSGEGAGLEFCREHAGNIDVWAAVASHVPEGSSITHAYGSVWGPRQELLSLAEAAEGAGSIPEGVALRLDTSDGYVPDTGLGTERPYMLAPVAAPAEMTGAHIASVNVENEPSTNSPSLVVHFDDIGTQQLCEVTERAVGSPLIIIADREIRSRPYVQEGICGGRVRISLGSAGSYDEVYRQAEELARVLRSGALPVVLTLESENIVGPSQ